MSTHESIGLHGSSVVLEPAESRVARASGTLGWLVAVPALAAVVIAVIGPWIAPNDVGRSVAAPFQPASSEHRLGTDQLGRDVWSEFLHGGRGVVLVPVLATVVTAAAAGLLGIVSGYFRGRVDMLISRVVDVMIAMPAILVLLVLVNGWGSSSRVLVLAVALTIGPYSMRYARAATIQHVTAGHVEQAVAQGESSLGVITRELLPNVAGALLSDAALRLVGSIYLISSASFLGFGPKPPATDWARQVNQNLQGVALNSWSVVLPAVAVAAFAGSVMLTADRMVRRWGA